MSRSKDIEDTEEWIAKVVHAITRGLDLVLSHGEPFKPLEGLRCVHHDIHPAYLMENNGLSEVKNKMGDQVGSYCGHLH